MLCPQQRNHQSLSIAILGQNRTLKHMCGRYSIALEPSEIEEHFHAKFVGKMQPRFNAAPSQKLPVILNSNPRKIILAPWGLKPVWLANVSRRDGLINVRAETLKEKRTFQADFAERRCLIPADGFYEWQTFPNKTKVPFRFVRADCELFAFAGIWEETHDATREPRFAIITTTANELMRPIHNRMPVILTPDGERIWLKKESSPAELLSLLQPAPRGELTAYEVSRLVNRGTVDSPEVIQAVA